MRNPPTDSLVSNQVSLSHGKRKPTLARHQKLIQGKVSLKEHTDPKYAQGKRATLRSQGTQGSSSGSFRLFPTSLLKSTPYSKRNLLALHSSDLHLKENIHGRLTYFSIQCCPGRLTGNLELSSRGKIHWQQVI